jgi:hypothetical protein
MLLHKLVKLYLYSMEGMFLMVLSHLTLTGTSCFSSVTESDVSNLKM